MTPYTQLDTPPDDASIWRFMNLEKLLSLLQSRQLFFVALDRFDDPYEGYYPAGVWQSIKHIFEEMARQQEGRLRLSVDEIRQLPRKLCYVNCWHVNQNESAAMWNLYAGRAGAEGHAGAAIKSTVGRLKTCFSTVQVRVNVGLVQYWDYATVTANEVGGTPVWYLKRKSFEHERELRAVTDRSLSEATAGVHVPVALDSLIEEIVVEPRAEDWVTNVVSNVVKKYGTFKVRRSDLYTLT
jgi:hypothetical protein